MCICVCICANNMQILGFGGWGGLGVGGDTIGGVWGSGDRAHICTDVHVCACMQVDVDIDLGLDIDMVPE